MINNKINETNTLLQIKSLFKKIKFDRESRLDISLGRLFQSFVAAEQNALPRSVGGILPLELEPQA